MVKPKIKTVEKKLTKLAHEYIYKRDKNKCQMCSKTVDGQNRHPSHVIPKSKSKYLRWNENNLKTLCFHCHINIWHKNPLEVGKWFKDKFPERYKFLQDNKNKTIKDERTERGITYREWLNEQIEYYSG